MPTVVTSEKSFMTLLLKGNLHLIKSLKVISKYYLLFTENDIKMIEPCTSKSEAQALGKLLND